MLFMNVIQSVKSNKTKSPGKHNHFTLAKFDPTSRRCFDLAGHGARPTRSKAGQRLHTSRATCNNSCS